MTGNGTSFVLSAVARMIACAWGVPVVRSVSERLSVRVPDPHAHRPNDVKNRSATNADKAQRRTLVAGASLLADGFFTSKHMVVMLGKSVGLVADCLAQAQRRILTRETDRLGLAMNVNKFFLLCQ